MNYVERHFDYVLGPTQDSQLSSIAAGRTITSVLELDSDAPFLLRSRALRVKFNALSLDQAGLNHVLARWYGADRQYTSQNFVRQSLLAPYFGQIGNPIPVHPQKFYPPQAEIRVDVKNDGLTAISNLTFVFRGVKLFRPGAVKAYSYPPKCAPFAFTYPQGTRSDTDGQTLIRNVPVTTGAPGLRNVFLCKTDADFVLQSLQGGGFNNTDTSGNPLFEVYVTLKDEDEKPYSNAPVPIDILCGNSAQTAIFPSGSTDATPAGGGPNLPGLVYPEIYIPKNHVFYYDIQRDDSAYAGAATSAFPLQFIGTKVFEK